MRWWGSAVRLAVSSSSLYSSSSQSRCSVLIGSLSCTGIATLDRMFHTLTPPQLGLGDGSIERRRTRAPEEDEESSSRQKSSCSRLASVGESGDSGQGSCTLLGSAVERLGLEAWRRGDLEEMQLGTSPVKQHGITSMRLTFLMESLREGEDVPWGRNRCLSWGYMAISFCRKTRWFRSFVTHSSNSSGDFT
ncbi:hypothetical protein CRUP_022730 [Coryphaenoides rupestris]|nr:hypothetical protein CRUP_022730 [Coryphaenoides rupestris]